MTSPWLGLSYNPKQEARLTTHLYGRTGRRSVRPSADHADVVRPSVRERATSRQVSAMSAAAVMGGEGAAGARGTRGRADPPMISPPDSAWDKNECKVARTSLVVR